MYFYCDCSLQRLKRSHSGSHKRLSASVAQRKAFSQCRPAQGFQPVLGLSANAMEWDGSVNNESPPNNYQQPTLIRMPEEEACHRNKSR